MTEDQRYYRNRARKEATRLKMNLRKAEEWVGVSHNRQRFLESIAVSCARDSAHYAFLAHPELRLGAVR